MIVEYINDLYVNIIDDEFVQLIAPFIVWVDDKEIVIHEGFVSDFSSVPRWCFAYLIAGGRGRKEAVLHDYLYVTGKYSKKFADEAFYAALKINPKVSKIVAWLMYVGVRLGGKGNFDVQGLAK